MLTKGNTLRKMRLAPAQTYYKLKIANRVEESVMRKSLNPRDESKSFTETVAGRKHWISIA